MILKYITIFLLMLLTCCTVPGSAFLGPAITGATTKNLGQASVSFGTNQILKKVQSASINNSNQVTKIVNRIDKFINNPHSRQHLNFHK